MVFKPTISLPIVKKLKLPKSQANLPKQFSNLEEAPVKQKPIAKISTPEVIRDQDTGRISGVTLSNGSTFFGNKREVEAIVNRQTAKTETPEGAVTAGTAQRQLELQQQINKIGQIGKLNPAVQADINISQAITAGAAKVIPAAVGGAALGATAGLIGSGGALSIPGAIGLGAAGAVTGFTSGILSNIKEQQRGELQAADIELTNARTNMRQLAMLASQDPANADIYISQYNDQLTRIYQARRQTKAEVTGDLNSFMEDGREQLADFDAFLQPGGIADIYGQKLSIALNSGIPLSINGEQLI